MFIYLKGSVRESGLLSTLAHSPAGHSGWGRPSRSSPWVTGSPSPLTVLDIILPHTLAASQMGGGMAMIEPGAGMGRHGHSLTL